MNLRCAKGRWVSSMGLIALLGCTSVNCMHSGPAQVPGTPARGGGPVTLTDPGLLSIAESLHLGEINAVEIGSARARHPRVREFVAMLREHHGRSLDAQRAWMHRRGITPMPNEISSRLMVDTGQSMAVLRSRSDREFDQSFLQSQIGMHENALRVIDERLLPNVRNDEFRRMIQSDRDMVRSHLVHARELLTRLERGE
jgi:putative membrane protein